MNLYDSNLEIEISRYYRGVQIPLDESFEAVLGFYGEFHGTVFHFDRTPGQEPPFEVQTLDLQQGRHYQIDALSDQNTSSLSVSLSCLGEGILSIPKFL